MPRSEQMGRPRRVQPHLGVHNRVHEVGVPVALHQRNDAANGMKIEVQRGHSLGALPPQVGENRALYRAGQLHLPLYLRTLLRPLYGDQHILPDLFVAVVRQREDIQNGSDIHADIPLKLHDLLGLHTLRAVYIRLKCAGIRHNRPVETDKGMNAVFNGLFPQLRAFPDDV